MQLQFKSGFVLPIEYDVYIDPAIILDERTETYRVVLMLDKERADLIDRNAKEKEWIGDIIFKNDTHELDIKLAALDKHITKEDTIMYEFDMTLDDACVYRKRDFMPVNKTNIKTKGKTKKK